MTDVSAAERLLSISAEARVKVSQYGHDPDTIARYPDRLAVAVEALGRSLEESQG